MRSKLCKTCIHTKICCHDKNLVGDVYVAPHPFLGSDYADKAWKRYQEWEAAGFPCEDYLSADIVEVIRCKDCKYWSELSAFCARRKNATLLGFGVNDFCSKAERLKDA